MKSFKEYIINEVADTFRVRAMVRKVIEEIIRKDRGIESLEELTNAVLDKHKYMGNDVQASKELNSWGKNAKTFVENIIKAEYLKWKHLEN